jgi:hypothetical protein
MEQGKVPLVRYHLRKCLRLYFQRGQYQEMGMVVQFHPHLNRW